jgi:hypothetical protein
MAVAVVQINRAQPVMRPPDRLGEHDPGRVAAFASGEHGSARREVRMSTSVEVQPPMAASSSSTGVKSASLVPMSIRPPRSLLTVNLLAATRSMDTVRCAESVAMPSTLPDRRPGSLAPGLARRRVTDRRGRPGEAS